MSNQILALMRAAWLAQASYALLQNRQQDLVPILATPRTADFSPLEAARLLGSAPFSLTGEQSGVEFRAHTPNDSTGFSATVFWDPGQHRNVLAIRGTEDTADFLQDARLAVTGFAADQSITLYRYYRRLTTPGGERVQYTDSEISLLHRLNTPIPFSLLGHLSNAALDLQLANDKGVARLDGAPGSVLNPSERLVVTGHSLGGHLALLFGRLFPQATDQIYSYNAPGVTAWGNALLDAAGLPRNDASRVTNVVAAQGVDMTAALGTRPGPTSRVFIELGSGLHNHSIVTLADSLALYDLFAKLSPGLADRINDISSILSAASAKPAESLEAALDMLRRVIAHDDAVTPIARTAADQAQRDAYFTRLFDLRDRFGDRNWNISSIVGLSATTLLQRASADMSVRRALSELTPFTVGAAAVDPSLLSLSQRWLSARAAFLASLMDANSADRLYGLSGTKQDVLYIDLRLNKQVSLLTPASAGLAQSQGASEKVEAFLSTFAFGQKTVFGSANADTVDGTSGADLLFGQVGNDALTGGRGDDVLVGGVGADVLDGGAGDDLYVYDNALDADRITDSDGRGAIEIAGAQLSGGALRADGSYASADGSHVYVLTGETLLVDGVLEIDDFHDGDLGIRLSAAPPVDATHPSTTTTVAGTPDADELGGVPGNTLFITNTSNDAVSETPPGDDVILLGDGDDFAFGGDGNDWIEGEGDGNFILAGRGNDVVYAGSSADDIDVAITLGTRTETHVALNFVSGGEGDDEIVGSGGRDYLEGSGGADLIIGGANADLIYGDGFALSAYVGEGTSGESFPHSESLQADGLYKGPRIFGTGNNPDVGSINPAYQDHPDGSGDRIYAGAGNDRVFGGRGDDLIFGGSGIDGLHGDDGDDSVRGEEGNDSLFGDAGNDLLEGGAGNDRLEGGAGDDRLDGGAGNDQLFGDAGNDLLVGGDGNDQLTGGAGADRLEGGRGADTFWLGDGDTIVLHAGDGAELVSADGAFPTAARILLAEETLPDDTVVVSSAASWLLASRTTPDRLGFSGALENWRGVSAEFSDGKVWGYDEFLQHRMDILEYIATNPPPGFPSNQLAGGAGADDLFGGTGNDSYYLAHGGHDRIDDPAGSDTLRLGDGRASQASVFRSGEDYLIRFPGAEVRLIGQADPAKGIESVQFADSTTWTRADLDARAVPLAETQSQSLGVQLATAGETFTYQVPTNAFAADYIIGAKSYDAADVRGGPLPEWLHFDAEHGVLSGTPAAADAGVTAVLIAQRDDGEVVDVAPVLIAVQGSAALPEGVGAPPPSGEPPPTAQAQGTVGSVPPDVGTAPAPPSVMTASSLSAPVATTDEVTQHPADPGPRSPGAFEVQQVGVIRDSTYLRIDGLLSTPALEHAPRFLERYAEAIQKFRERLTGPPELPAEPPPTDDDMARYNAAMHAWLDNHAWRIAHSADDGWEVSGGGGFYGAAGISVDSGRESAPFSRPELTGLAVIQAPPGLREGLQNVSG